MDSCTPFLVTALGKRSQTLDLKRLVRIGHFGLDHRRGRNQSAPLKPRARCSIYGMRVSENVGQKPWSVSPGMICLGIRCPHNAYSETKTSKEDSCEDSPASPRGGC